MFDQIAGIKIVPSDFWPKVPDGTETLRFQAHPIVQWLARWLPIDPWVECEVPKMKDADPLLDKARMTIFCSHAQYWEIRRSLPIVSRGDV